MFLYIVGYKEKAFCRAAASGVGEEEKANVSHFLSTGWPPGRRKHRAMPPCNLWKMESTRSRFGRFAGKTVCAAANSAATHLVNERRAPSGFRRTPGVTVVEPRFFMWGWVSHGDTPTSEPCIFQRCVGFEMVPRVVFQPCG